MRSFCVKVPDGRLIRRKSAPFHFPALSGRRCRNALPKRGCRNTDVSQRRKAAGRTSAESGCLPFPYSIPHAASFFHPLSCKKIVISAEKSRRGNENRSTAAARRHGGTTAARRHDGSTAARWRHGGTMAARRQDGDRTATAACGKAQTPPPIRRGRPCAFSFRRRLRPHSSTRTYPSRRVFRRDIRPRAS